MKKQFTFIVVVLLVTFIGVQSPTYGQWPKYIIEDYISSTVNVDVADMDGDTKLDLVVTAWGNKKLVWYKNDFPHWIKYTIDDIGATFAWTADINGNGTLDVVANLYSAGQMVWYENNLPTWTKHIIDANTDNADFMVVADIDGDDTLDVVTAGGYNHGGDVVWYENNHPIWTKHIIESGSGKYPTVNVTDIDGDGLLDVAATMNESGKVVWFRNENNGLSWSKHTIDDNLSPAWGVHSGDIDGNGTIDIAATAGGSYLSGSDVVWYENNHPTWTKYVIDANLPKANVPFVTDVDGDDTMDVIVTGYGEGVVVWYENNHPVWTKNIIDANLDRPRLTAVSDIDGDNISDLFVAGGNCVAWYKNPYTTVAFGDSVEVFPRYIRPEGDTVKVVAQISNPENHPITVYAMINGDQNTFQDSIELFDDGLHGDGVASDNTFGGSKLLLSIEEDFYNVKLHTTDLDESLKTYCANVGLFTTAGPIEIESYSVVEVSKGLIGLADFILKNNGTEKTIENIVAELKTSDTCVTEFVKDNSGFGDLAAGESYSAALAFAFNIDSCATIVNFELEISSNGVVYWTDSFMVDVATDIEDELPNLPKEYALEQNYPNPFNPSTTIKYSIPNQSYVILKVFDVLGRQVATLVNKEQPQGNYEVKLDASNLTSGIYFYTMQAGEFMETKKMILIK